jgi:heptosyltransferase I
MVKTIRRERANHLLKFLDRYLGIPLVFFLRLFKKTRPLPDRQIKNIGLLKTAAIGDTVLLSAIVSDLQKKYSAPNIVLFTGSSNYEYAKIIQGLRQVVLLPISRPLKSVHEIQKFQFDVFIDFGSWPRLDAILAHFSKSKYAIGFKTEGQYRHYLFDHVVGHSKVIHEIENYRNLIRTLGVNSFSLPRIEIAEKETGSNLKLEKPYIVFHPWPGGFKSYMKEWPVQNWVSLAKQVVGLNYDIVITGSAADATKSEEIVAHLERNGARAKNIAGKLSFTDTICLIKNAKLMVCVNTGIMHIAAAMDVPLVALHGPTSPNRWGPLSKKAKIIVPDLAGCGYLNLGWEYPANPPDCMQAITVEEILHVVKSLLEEAN